MTMFGSRVRFLHELDEHAAAAALFATPAAEPAAPAPAAPAAPAAVEAGAEPAPDPTPAAAGAEPAAPSSEPAVPAWAADPAFHEAVEAQASEIAQREIAALMRSLEQPDPQTPADGEIDWSQFDLTDPQHFAWFMQYQQEQTLKQVQGLLAPVLNQSQAQAQQESDQRLQDALADAVAREQVEWATPDSSDAAKQLASVLFVEEQSRFPLDTRRAAQSAIDRGVKMIAQIERAAGEKAVTAYKNQMSTIAGAPREPGAGATASVEGLPDADTEMDVVRRMFGDRVNA